MSQVGALKSFACLVTGAVFTCIAAAQGLPRDCVVFGTARSAFRVLYTGGGGSWATIVDQGPQYAANGESLGGAGAFAVDEDGILYSHRWGNNLVAPIGSDLVRFTLDTNTNTFQYQPPWREVLADLSGLPLHPVYGMFPRFPFVTRGAVWMNLYGGQFARFDKSSLSQPASAFGPTIPSGFILGVLGVDGREVYAGVWNAFSGYGYIVAVDLETPGPSWRLIRQQQWVPQVGFTAALGRDQMIYLLDRSTGVLEEVDCFTGATRSSRSLSIPFLSRIRGFRYDPWSDRLLLSDGTNSRETRLVWGDMSAASPAWSLAYVSPWVYTNWFPYDSHGQIEFTNEMPFESFGKGCVNGLGKEPRLGWRGMPLQGQTFTLRLRDAEPGTLAIVWLGWSDTSWGMVGSLPFDAAPYGAPGCSLLVAPDGALPFVTDAAGCVDYTVTVPQHPVINGLQVFAQSVSVSTANAFGFGTSDAVAIRMR